MIQPSPLPFAKDALRACQEITYPILAADERRSTPIRKRAQGSFIRVNLRSSAAGSAFADSSERLLALGKMFSYVLARSEDWSGCSLTSPKPEPLRPDPRVPLRQAPSSPPKQPEPDHPRRLLLELPQPECRAQTGRRATPAHRAIPETVHRNRRRPVRLRLGLARSDAERNSRTACGQRPADDPEQAPAVLHRPPQRAAQALRSLLEAGQLGLRRQEHERLKQPCSGAEPGRKLAIASRI